MRTVEFENQLTEVLLKLSFIEHFQNVMPLKAFIDVAPGEIRTPDPLVRRLVL